MVISTLPSEEFLEKDETNGNEKEENGYPYRCENGGGGRFSYSWEKPRGIEEYHNQN